MSEQDTKWTEIELLPEWDEKFYDVYTAKKHGKWLMLKTLKAAYKDDPRFQAMIEKEFDVRYNLAHSNIVMINDFEDVPTLGLLHLLHRLQCLHLLLLLQSQALCLLSRP